RVLRQALDVLHGVARGHAGPEIGPADVDGIGAVVDRLDADVGVARGSEQLQLVVEQGHGGARRAAGRTGTRRFYSRVPRAAARRAEPLRSRISGRAAAPARWCPGSVPGRR